MQHSRNDTTAWQLETLVSSSWMARWNAAESLLNSARGPLPRPLVFCPRDKIASTLRFNFRDFGFALLIRPTSISWILRISPCFAARISQDEVYFEPIFMRIFLYNLIDTLYIRKKKL